ncbi:hypothetical protein PC116_g26867 [Phytophthora cactorum]|nr:hypothetical protein PC128_g25348 [Phytophthora cactorum]KAG4224686.1 hypothetical protein PC116_g26867 [Phytophthora cactorum]
MIALIVPPDGMHGLITRALHGCSQPPLTVRKTHFPSSLEIPIPAYMHTNRLQQRLAYEKETLQRQEMELSSELSRLQSAQKAEKMRYVNTMSLSVWRAIATRQKEKRLEAEQNQRQLRAAVVGRARMIHQMKALLQHPYVTEEKDILRGESDTGQGDGSESRILYY